MNLNPSKEQRVPFKEFYGKNTEQMACLIADKRKPASIQDIITQRLKFPHSDWCTNYFDTGDAIMYYENEIKIVTGKNVLCDMNAETQLKNGAIELSVEQYLNIKGKVFDRKNLMLDTDLTKEEVLVHPMWNIVLKNKKELKAYVELVFAYTKDTTNMGVYVATASKMPTARALYVYGLEDRSRLLGWGNLGYDNGRLVGVCRELKSSRTPRKQKFAQASEMLRRKVR